MTTQIVESTELIDGLMTLSEYKVIKRNNEITNYNPYKIFSAIRLAFIEANGTEFVKAESTLSYMIDLTNQVSKSVLDMEVIDKSIDIESLQKRVENTLMNNKNLNDVARHYIEYRYKRALERSNKEPNETISVQYDSLRPFDKSPLLNILTQLSSGLDSIDVYDILNTTHKQIFNGITYKELMQTVTLTARMNIEINPEYSTYASRIMKYIVTEETRGYYDNTMYCNSDINFDYSTLLKQFIQMGVKHALISDKLNDFDLDYLSQEMDVTRDEKLTYLSIQTLYDRYLIHHNKKRIELPQMFFMRVAMGLAGNYGDNKNKKAAQFYHLISSLDYMCSTPTLFNSGTCRPQLSSCFLTTVSDNLRGIFSAIGDNASLSKYAGGLGNDWSQVRGQGSYIKGTNGESSGVVPFLNVADATAIAVNQGGKRKGAVCAYLTTWHMDIEEFIELRKNTGDDRRRTHDMNTANWIPDLFMQRVQEKSIWTLFSPDEVPGLHDAFGEKFAEMYSSYELLAKEGKIRSKTIGALDLWRKILSMVYETGHPWITFKDPCNIRSPQQHCGTIHSSNLCTEITLNTSSNNSPDDEVAVCNLGSINLVNHMLSNGEIDKEKLQNSIQTAIEMLDTVIDVNYYSIPQAKTANQKHRPVGLGLMGFQDALYIKNIAYDSDEAVRFSDECMELISYYAIQASINLAKEKGVYASYEGSLWSQNILPIDSLRNLISYRKQYINVDDSCSLDWEPIRQNLKKYGIRNSNILAIAPTATISNICGVSASIDPSYQNLYVRSNMSGEFTIINKYLYNKLKKAGLWDKKILADLKFNDGSVQKISRIPSEIKNVYKTAFEIDPIWLVKCGSRRQKWLDQSQSLNLYMAVPSGKKLSDLYQFAWMSGLKTTYYLRTLGASNAEKSTVNDRSLNKVSSAKACSIEDPDCEACQ
ncbi:MAG TPA: ribonucleoside-diphosphate reductase subunit alpha [Gammaproteobacteria bacterium]|nr:ribonucleoside-diphosphate reductase subunit alpha [Gammaproteobacteria bacterium]